MTAETIPLGTSVEDYLDAHEQKSMLRFITCGSVDDGKSTLIGRLLYESRVVLDDQLSALEADSKRFGTRGDGLDLALLVDGLSAEREQGITIDVAYRFFTTDTRKFIVADSPGHEQYTRNMVTGASTADLAVILVDARQGVLTQTRRHTFVASLLGIDRIVLAINKMDLVDWDRARAEQIADAYRSFAAELGLTDIAAIPLSAALGDNVVHRGTRTPWYHGPTLLEHLDTVQPVPAPRAQAARLTVQTVLRPDGTFRGFAGPVVGGTLHSGDQVEILPSGATSAVNRIVTFDGDLAQAESGSSVVITLTDEVDVSRGDVIAAGAEPAPVGDRFETDVVWMSEQRLRPGRRYLVKLGTATAGGVFETPDYRVDIDTLDHVPADTLGLNDIAVCSLRVDRLLAYERYRDNRQLGGFLIIDPQTFDTVGAGMIRRHRSETVPTVVTPAARAERNGHRAAVIRLVGAEPGVAAAIENHLHAMGAQAYLLADTDTNTAAAAAAVLVDAGLIVLTTAAVEVARLEPDQYLTVDVTTGDPARAVAQALRQNGILR